LLVPPWALSPESMFLLVLAAVLLLATWLAGVGRSSFAHENEYRRLTRERDAAVKALADARERPFTALKGIDERVRARLQQYQDRREEARLRASAEFGHAQRDQVVLQQRVQQARDHALRCWLAYAEANRRARAPGNPPPAMLGSPMAFGAVSQIERDMLAGFIAAHDHARDLCARSEASCGVALRALAIYMGDVAAHLQRVVRDPGLNEEPPSFELALRYAAGAAFQSAADRAVSGGDALRKFLGLDKP
jgi:hypothetical protein